MPVYITRMNNKKHKWYQSQMYRLWHQRNYWRARYNEKKTQAFAAMYSMGSIKFGADNPEGLTQKDFKDMAAQVIFVEGKNAGLEAQLEALYADEKKLLSKLLSKLQETEAELNEVRTLHHEDIEVCSDLYTHNATLKKTVAELEELAINLEAERDALLKDVESNNHYLETDPEIKKLIAEIPSQDISVAKAFDSLRAHGVYFTCADLELIEHDSEVTTLLDPISQKFKGPTEVRGTLEFQLGSAGTGNIASEFMDYLHSGEGHIEFKVSHTY